MVRLDPEAFSTRWYQDVLGIGEGTGSNRGHEWGFAARNSITIALFATLLATTIGTLAAVGLSRPHMPYRRPIMALLISPLIVPIIITAAGMFFFYSKVGLAYSHLGSGLSARSDWHAVCGDNCNRDAGRVSTRP